MCGQDVNIVSVGGTREFLSEHTFSGDHDIIVWNCTPKYDCRQLDGGVGFCCENGHKHYVEYSNGDWR